MRVLICGTRDHASDIMIDAVVAGLKTVAEGGDETLTVIHGAARGADTWAGEAAEALGLTPVPFPANWTKYGKAAGPIRNKQMLDEGQPEFTVAFLDIPFEESKGTANMINQSLKAGLTVYMIQKLEPPKPEPSDPTLFDNHD